MFQILYASYQKIPHTMAPNMAIKRLSRLNCVANSVRYDV
jgi:hypothetical protein